MNPPYPTPCIHGNGTGLCEACQADFDCDPSAYEEYGQHPSGIANWRALQEEIARDAAETGGGPVYDESIPF